MHSSPTYYDDELAVKSEYRKLLKFSIARTLINFNCLDHGATKRMTSITAYVRMTHDDWKPKLFNLLYLLWLTTDLSDNNTFIEQPFSTIENRLTKRHNGLATSKIKMFS